MKRRFFSVTLLLAMCLTLAVQANAEIDGDYSESDYIIGLRTVESFVEAELIAKKENQAMKDTWFEDVGPLHDITLRVSKTVRGITVSAGDYQITTHAELIDVGDKLIIGLRKLSNSERNERRDSQTNMTWEYDPGPYRIQCLLRWQADDRLVSLNAGVNGIIYPSFDELVKKIEGKQETEYTAVEADGGKALELNGHRLHFATVTQRTTVYDGRSAKSKALLTLEPYDRVVLYGVADRIGNQRWDKILLADYRIGFVPEGRMKISSKHSERLDTALIADVIETTQLRDRQMNTIAYASVRAGTATIVLETPWIYNYDTDKINALRAGPQEHGIVPKSAIKLWEPGARGETLATVYDFGDVLHPEQIRYAFPNLNDGIYWSRTVANSTKVYTSKNTTSKALVSLGKGDVLLQSGAVVKSNGVSWVKVLLSRGRIGYVSESALTKDKRVYCGKSPMSVDMPRSAYTYTLKDGVLAIDKNYILRAGTVVALQGGPEIFLYGKYYQRVFTDTSIAHYVSEDKLNP